MAERVRVWHGRDREWQHFADPAPGEVVKRWEGTTLCGASGGLTWIPPERVDAGSHCGHCLELAGSAPALEGDHPGPV